jgi:hypothetical protein
LPIAGIAHSQPKIKVPPIIPAVSAGGSSLIYVEPGGMIVRPLGLQQKQLLNNRRMSHRMDE